MSTIELKKLWPNLYLESRHIHFNIFNINMANKRTSYYIDVTFHSAINHRDINIEVEKSLREHLISHLADWEFGLES